MSVEVSWSVSAHPAEGVLEEYNFGRVHEPALSALEEHLFVCPACRSRLEELDEYAALMKAALERFGRERKISHGSASWFLIPRVARASLLLAAGMMLVFVSGSIAWHSPSVPAAAVQLAALRGGGGAGDNLTTAPADRPLDLKVNAANLPPAPAYRVELVDQSGRTLWTGEANHLGAQLSAHVPSGHGPGVYWVRLYSEHAEATRGEIAGDGLLREFGMRLQ